MDDSSKFLLNEQNMQLLTRGVNSYLVTMKDLAEKDVSYENNAALFAYQVMAERIKDFKTPEQMSTLIQSKDTESHFKAICDYYHNHEDYKNSLVNSKLIFIISKEESLKEVNHTFLLGIQLIREAVSKRSSFVCPKIKLSDDYQHCKMILDLNKNANRNDIFVFIAAVYVLFLCKQERDTLRTVIENNYLSHSITVLQGDTISKNQIA
jgi:hypothetical protein